MAFGDTLAQFSIRLSVFGLQEPTDVTKREFEIAGVRAVAYFDRPFASRDSIMLFKKIPADWDKELDGETLFFPLGSELPEEIPVPLFSLSSKDTSQVVSVTRQRIELHYKQISEKSVDLAESINNAKARLAHVFDNGSVEANRLAVVVQRNSREVYTAKMLAMEFCTEQANKGPLARPESFEIHAHKAFDAKFGKLNSWVRLKSAKRTRDGVDVVIMEQDMNTAAPHKTLSKIEVDRFFSTIVADLDECFAKYYPQ